VRDTRHSCGEGILNAVTLALYWTRRYHSHHAKGFTVTQRARGFSVIESLIAIVLLSFSMLSLFGLISTSFGYTEQDSERIQAIAASQQYLDAIRQAMQNAASLPAAPTVPVDPGFGQTGHQITASQNFSMANNLCPLVPGTKVMHNCQVTTTWTESGATKTVTVQSNVSQQ
jgi:Tfp pilus assembly protein PilV